MIKQDDSNCCGLCGRKVEQLTRHHLIPRTRHRNKRTQKNFTRAQMEGRILWVCRPCHNQIHAVLSEKELERRYNSAQRLLGHPDIQTFVEWIKTKPSAFEPQSRGMRRS